MDKPKPKLVVYETESLSEIPEPMLGHLKATAEYFGMDLVADPGSAFCPECGLCPCACIAKAFHSEDCRFHKASVCPISVPCDHGLDVCPECDPCTCKETEGTNEHLQTS